jgi:hypothetical protein
MVSIIHNGNMHLKSWHHGRSGLFDEIYSTYSFSGEKLKERSRSFMKKAISISLMAEDELNKIKNNY